MYVTRKYHDQIIFILLGTIFILTSFIILIIIKPDILTNIRTSNLQSYINTNELKILEAATSPFLHEEQVAMIKCTNDDPSDDIIIPIKKPLFEYVEVTDGCGPHFEGECLNLRSGPGEEYPIVKQLRNSLILKVDGKVERDGQVWYKIVFDEWLRYPERAEGDFYVNSNYVKVLLDEGIKTTTNTEYATTTTKKIIVERSTQTLYAYEDDKLFMEEKISTGLELSPTPKGEFIIFRKTPSRYMQGPIPEITGSNYYDLPGVPWNLYFTHGGAVIHGAYWHTSFGEEYSHGCVNLPPDIARKLYNWAGIGTHVIVKD